VVGPISSVRAAGGLIEIIFQFGLDMAQVPNMVGSIYIIEKYVQFQHVLAENIA
jgi:hypothetical protein